MSTIFAQGTAEETLLDHTALVPFDPQLWALTHTSPAKVGQTNGPFRIVALPDLPRRGHFQGTADTTIHTHFSGTDTPSAITVPEPRTLHTLFLLTFVILSVLFFRRFFRRF